MISKRSGFAVLTAGCVIAVAAGCGGGGSAAGPKAIGLTTPTITTPAATGSLDSITWDLPNGEPSTLDPAKVGDYSPSTVEANLCDPLLRLKPDYSTGPGLARSWTRPDDRTLVLDIRSGVTFWDGKPLTAADVAYSLNRQRDAKSGAINGAALQYATSVTATGPLQVTVKFSQPDELFLKLLATEIGAVSEAAYVRREGQNYGQAGGGLMCTGPYELKSWQSGQSITITRNPHYWDATLQPKVATVKFTFVTDAATLSSSLLSGEIDGSYEVPLPAMRALSSSTVGSRYYGISTQTVMLAVAGKDSPLADRRLLDALDLTLDKNAIVTSVYGGAAQTEKSFIPPAVWQGSTAKATYQQGYDALPAVTTPDLAAAKKLVAAVNPSRRSFTAAIPAGDQVSLQILTFLQAGAKQIGLNLTIKQYQPADFSNLFYVPAKRAGLDLVIAEGYLEVPDPLSYAVLLATPYGPFNWGGYNDPKATSLIARSQAALDQTTSARLFTQAQAIYTAKLASLPVTSPYERLFMNKRISGAPSSFAHINLPWAAMIGGTGK